MTAQEPITCDGVIWWFFEDFRPLSEDFQRFSKIVPKARQTSPNIFPEFLKIPEDVRRLPKTFDEDRKMFRWYTNEFKYNLRDKLDISEIIDIFTCEDVVSLLSICYHSVYHWLLYNKYSFLIDAVLEVAILLSWRHSAITVHAGKIERASWARISCPKANNESGNKSYCYPWG